LEKSGCALFYCVIVLAKGGETMRTTKKDLLMVQKMIFDKYGYQKFRCQGRYGYIGIDEFDEKGGCLRTYKTGLTKKQAYETLYDLWRG
jgi:hypothetical protein